jgi:hypothetical protein
MKVAKIQVKWEKSPSSDVSKYIVIVIDETTNTPMLHKEVSHAEREFTFVCQSNTNLTITLIANNGYLDSVPVSTSLNLGDLMIPEPVGNLSVKILEVFDSEDLEAALGGDDLATPTDE